MTAPFVLPAPSPTLLTAPKPVATPAPTPSAAPKSVTTPATPRRSAAPLSPAEILLRESDRILAAAAREGQSWRMVGVSSLDPVVRGYCGPSTDWVLVPASLDPILRSRGNLPMPKQARAALAVARRTYDFPVMYVAHEIPKGTLRPDGSFDGQAFADRPDAVGSALLDTVPTHVRATAGARRLAASTDTASRVARLTAGAALATAVAAPFALAAVLASGGLDPVLIGAVPLHGRVAAGVPAAYLELARWDY